MKSECLLIVFSTKTVWEMNDNKILPIMTTQSIQGNRHFSGIVGELKPQWAKFRAGQSGAQHSLNASLKLLEIPISHQTTKSELCVANCWNCFWGWCVGNKWKMISFCWSSQCLQLEIWWIPAIAKHWRTIPMIRCGNVPIFISKSKDVNFAIWLSFGKREQQFWQFSITRKCWQSRRSIPVFVDHQQTDPFFHSDDCSCDFKHCNFWIAAHLLQEHHLKTFSPCWRFSSVGSMFFIGRHMCESSSALAHIVVDALLREWLWLLQTIAALQVCEWFSSIKPILLTYEMPVSYTHLTLPTNREV